ncbi:FAD-dependent oxidoreductase [Peribacillus sp. NPDC046944]|uniref:oxidoreductase n=1 Tax=unclassified Peribacillus TaxID=2675266 RepID=UPI003D06A483
MTKHQHLFSPFTLGRITLRNRIVGTAHGTAMITDGVPMEEDIKYWEERARGGAGLLITGGTIVHPSSRLRRRMLNEAYLEETVPMFRRRAEAIHANGAKVIGQLVHLGREMIGGESDYPLRAPSAIQSPRALYRPIELTHIEINEIIDAFVLSALNLKKAGYDGVEIHAAHGYLVAQFLSSGTNKRNDEYGGSLKGRMRFLLQLLEAIRKETGSDFVIGVRLSAEEEVSGGMQLADTLQIVKVLSGISPVDYLNITKGIRGGYVKDLTIPQGVTVDAAREIRSATNIPILVSQRIKDPNMAEKILAEGAADLVGITRALIADPEWPLKAETGRSYEIIPCIGCNQDCRSFDPFLYCAVNPTTGRENELDRIIPKSNNIKKVAVVGGGPAGLEAARVAALRGHSVELFEKEATLGGQVRIAAREPNRRELIDVIHYLESEVRRLEVTVNLNQAVDVNDLNSFDTVILATGAVPEQPKVHDSIKGKVLTVYDVLKSDDLSKGVGETAVVVDDGTGFWPSLSTAGCLAAKGYKVIYVTPSRTIGASIPHESIQLLLNRLSTAGVQFMILHQIAEANGNNIKVRNVLSGEETLIESNLLVIDAGRRQENTLAKQLRDVAIPAHLVGDAISPRRISHAILEGHRIARKI